MLAAMCKLEQRIELFLIMEPKTINGWKENRDSLAMDWRTFSALMEVYLATCPDEITEIPA